MPKSTEREVIDVQELMNAHSALIRSTAAEHDTFSLAQPSPFKYVPSITTNRTSYTSEDPTRESSA